ncbi:MAG: ABC transporter permease [Gemmatimonadota bacterium]
MSRLLYRLRALLRPRRFDQELEEELQGHLAREADRNRARGMSPDDADAAARRGFGNFALLKEDARSSAAIPMLEQGWKNLRFAARSLRRRPSFTFTAVLSLALGLGASATVLAVFNALLLRPLPYADPGRLVAIWPGHTLANREVEALRVRSQSYREVASFSPGWLMPLTGIETPRLLNAAKVSGNFFPMLGVPPLLGRTFGLDAEAVGAEQRAVLTERLWREAFGGDPAIIGRGIQLDGTRYSVVAIMPGSFGLIDSGTDLWVPMTMDPNAMSWEYSTTLGLGRLRDGVTPASASAELGGLARQMQQDFKRNNTWARDAAVSSLQESLVGDARLTLVVLLGAVGSLLLLAVINVANLLIVRTLERNQEMAVRASLGATTRQVAGLLMMEALLLSAAGGLAGLALASAGLSLLRLILPPSLPRQSEIAIDGWVLGTVALLVAAVGVVCTVAAVRQTRSHALGSSLRKGRSIAHGGRQARGVLVACEIALALVLTIGAALMIRTMLSLRQVDRGLRSEHLLTMQLLPPNLPDSGRATLWRTILQQVANVPGVTAAATVLHLPMSGRNWMADIRVEGRDLPAGSPLPRAGWQSVSPEYFRVAGIPLIAGRPFSDADGANAPRVIAVNAAFAERLFPGESPIGKRVAAGNATRDQIATIVAVVGNVRHDSLNVQPTPEVYATMWQRPVGASALIVRTSVSPVVVAPAIRQRIAEINRDIPISDIRTMDDVYAASLQRPRMVLALMGVFATLGLLLSGVGIYGVVAYGVRQRRKEIGIRLALGGSIDSIRRLVVREGLRYALLGVGIGLPAAFVLTRLMRGLVFGIPTFDPLSFAGVATILLLIAILASWAPAHRATRTNPVEVLRE